MRRWFKIAMVAVLIGLPVGLGVRFCGAARQQAACAAADAYADRMQPVLSADARFQNVVVYQFSGYGCALYYGNVLTEADLGALQGIIGKSSPPRNIEVKCWVKVGPANPAATEGLRKDSQTRTQETPK